MTENPTPRQMFEGLLQGISPPRPLFLPIVFSVGAKMENLPLAAFLKNPTKISNSLRQMRRYLRSDGVPCYFDPYLEVEALGATLDWGADGHLPTVRWPGRAPRGELPEGLCSADEAAKRGRVGVATEVIGRLKSLLRDDALLTVGVTGPVTLAARIAGLDVEEARLYEQLPDAALEAASSLITRISSAYAEAGANLIFIQEEALPSLSAENCEAWASRLAPTLNVVRFYRALPVLHLASNSSLAENSDVILQRQWECIVCPPVDWTQLPSTIPRPGGLQLCIALPLDAFQPDHANDESLDRFLDYAMSELRPAVLTTAADVPAGTDMRRLKRVLERVSRSEPARQPETSRESRGA